MSLKKHIWNKVTHGQKRRPMFASAWQHSGTSDFPYFLTICGLIPKFVVLLEEIMFIIKNILP